MNLRFTSFVFACAVAVMAAGFAHAQPRITPPGGGGGGGGGGGAPSTGGGAGLVTAVTAEQVAQLMNQAGYKEVSVAQTQQGSKFVRAKVGEIPVVGLFGGCEGAGCVVVVFRAFFGKQENIDARYIFAWNDAYLISRLYRDSDGDLTFDMGMHLLSGVTPEYIQRTSVLYASLLGKLLEFKPGQK
jgi:hypothetical protein